MATHTTCDACGLDLTNHHRQIRVDVGGALRLRDASHYDLCPPCWDHGLAAMVRRVKLGDLAVADFVAQRREQLPVDRPRRDATSNLGDFTVECGQCHQVADLNGVDFTRLYSSTNTGTSRGVERTFYIPTLPCGHTVHGLTVTVNAAGYVDRVEHHTHGSLAASELFPETEESDS